MPKVPFPFTCSYCGHSSTITSANYSTDNAVVNTELSKFGSHMIMSVEATTCPNQNCKQLTMVTRLWEAVRSQTGYRAATLVQTWPLLPESRARPQPDYIPEAIRKTYKEACLIRDLSPSASATLSRRCLQAIIWDFWEIPENERGSLGAAINSIKEKIDAELAKTIENLRAMGDIGAHMDKHVDQIVDVAPDEAGLMIELIETLLEDWYVERETKRNRMQRLQTAVDEKRTLQKAIKTQRKALPAPDNTQADQSGGDA